jgi:hypothetical protein
MIPSTQSANGSVVTNAKYSESAQTDQLPDGVAADQASVPTKQLGPQGGMAPSNEQLPVTSPTKTLPPPGDPRHILAQQLAPAGTAHASQYLVVSGEQQVTMELFFGKGNVSFVPEGDNFRVVLGDGAIQHLKNYAGNPEYKAFLTAVALGDGSGTPISLEAANQEYLDLAAEQKRTHGSPYRVQLEDGRQLVRVPNRFEGYALLGKDGQLEIPASGLKGALDAFGKTALLYLAVLPIFLPELAVGDAAIGAVVNRAAAGEAGAARIATSIPRAAELRLSGTVQNQIKDVVTRGPFKGELANPYTNSRLLLQEIMDAKPPIPDPQGVANALRWDVTGTFRGVTGTWELVVDVATKTVLHFKFVK